MPGKIVLLNGKAVILPAKREDLVKSELYQQWKSSKVQREKAQRSRTKAQRSI